MCAEPTHLHERYLPGGDEPERGNVLLLALFILSSLLIASAALSAILIRDLRSSRAIDDGQSAYYAAESGLEETLYALRRADATIADVQSGSESLANGSSYARITLQGEQDYYVPSVPVNGVIDLNLWNPDDPSISTGIESLSFEWSDDCSGCTKLEVGYSQWLVGPTFTWPPSPDDYTGTFWKLQGSMATGIWYLNDLVPARNYRLRVRNLQIGAQTDAIKDLHVRAYKDDAHTIPADIPSRAFITVTGRYGVARQALAATMQRFPALSGIFNYVIFSETDLIK